MTDTVTPETGTVDAPASMESVLAEFDTGAPAADAADEVAAELVEDAEEGDAGKATDSDGDATDADEADEESDSDADSEDDEPEPTHKVKVNGEEVEVPLSELLKGYSRERDYTTKTQALAEERKAVETRASELNAKYASELKQATDLFVHLDPILSECQNLDWQALAQEDPTTYTQLKAAYDARVQAVGQARAEIQRIEGEQTEAAKAERQQAEQAETDALIKAAPEKIGIDLTDPAKMAEFATSVVGYLKAEGFQNDEIADLVDHKALLIVEKARKYDAIQKAKAGLPAKKVVQKSAVKPLKTDGSDRSQATRKRLSPNASRDQRVAHVLSEFMQE